MGGGATCRSVRAILRTVACSSALTVAVVALAAVTLVPAPLTAQSAPRGSAQDAAITPVVSTEWLARELARPALVVLQIGSAESFATAHIPGAVRLDFDNVIVAPPVEGGLRMELPEASALQASLRALGVNNATRVVLVFEQPSAFLRAGRAFFTLEWAGLEGRVAVLDGGLAAWRAAGRMVATGTGRTPTAGDVTLVPQPVRVASRAEVIESVRASGPRLVDARTPEFYGNTRDNGMPRGGHIASAVNLPFNIATLPDGSFKPRAELEQLVAAAGIAADDALTTYCHIGLQASWMYLTLRHLGRRVSLYDGSFDDWSRDAALPLGETPAARP
jgi:thiosulfate/3-mercaptopyruvate sulfurtransferase